jgi:type VI secretion system protein ImpL
MSAQSDQLKSVLGISALVSFYGIASLALLFLGPSIGLSFTWEIIIIAMLLLTWPIVILLNHLRKRRARKKEAAAAGDGSGAAPPKSGKAVPGRVYEDLTRGAEEAVQWLRSRLSGAKSGEALYALPWYIVAGSAASGKTSLVLSSGLDFHALPSQRRGEMKIVRPTHNVDWRVTDSAVLLDTAGRYQTDGPARDEWLALTEILKKYRNNRPLDGLLVAVNAERILHASEADIEQQAKTLRARLDEIKQQVRIRFPVYLIFTNIDSLEGFDEFFRAGQSNAKSEVWGATIPLAKSANAHALFDGEFDELFDSLVRRRLLQLRAPAAPGQQLRIFDFPLRFAAARSRLGLLSSALFRPNPFSESPLLRGFYFTGNVTDGRTGASAVSENGEERAAQAVGRGFFTDRLFKEVVLRDKDLASSFQASQKRPPRWRAVLLALGVVFLFLIVVGAMVSFIANRKLVADATDRGTNLRSITDADKGKDLSKKDPAAARVEVEATEALRDTLSQLDDYDRGHPPLYLRFGLYAGNEINPRLRNIYFDSLNQRYYKQTVAGVERDLRAFAAATTSDTPTVATSSTASNAPATAPSAEDVLGRNYDLLKAYLMLGDPSKVEPTFLAGQLQDYWKNSSPPEMELLSQQQLDFFSRQAIRDDAPHAKVDAKLVGDVRRKLAAYPPVNRFYKRVVTEINGKTQPVSIDSVLEGRGRGVMAGTYTVPGSFTIDGYTNYMKAAILNAGDEISKDDWVMGTTGGGATTQNADLSKLQGMYLRDYTDQWRKFLRGLSIRSYKSKDDAVDSLRTLSATDSPMSRVMAEVARNTNFSAKPEGRGIWGWIKSWFVTDTGSESGGNTEVEKEFRPLFQFVASGDAKKDTSPLSQYRAELRRVLDPLEATSESQLQQAQAALLTGKDDLGLQKADQAISGLLESFKTPAAQDTAAVLKQPLGNLRALLYGRGFEEIVKGWNERLYPKAHALEAGYPFTDAGEASMADLGAFLNPANGQLTTFYNEKLANSFEDAQGEWRLKEAGALKFSDDFVKYLNGARKLRESLFAPGGQQPEVGYDLTLQPVPNADVVIEIDGTKVESRGTSPQSAKFIWPARSGSSGARITVIAAGGQAVDSTYPGTWGLFKMFDASSRSQSTLDQYDLSWDVGGVQVHATLRPASANNPFLRSLFKNLRAPQNLQK